MNRECWLEMDLYWFQGGSVEEKSKELFDRLTPLLNRSPEARKGICLCVGWLFDMVFEWNGDPDATIPCCQAPTYETWTYRRLRDLVTGIKAEAGVRGLTNFHVALILMGIETQSFPESAFEGWGGRTEQRGDKANYDIEGHWFGQHPEVYDERFDIFFFGSQVKMPDNEAICKADSPSLGVYFADKLASVTSYAGFGAVVLRDHIFTRAYIRGNGKGRYMPPSDREAWNGAMIEMLGRAKSMSPNLILIGYSSGTSSIEEWRSHGFDLEQVARTGHLDLWITQTWASAWGDYWPAHSMGYTFQLMNALVHQAMLADTPCGHLFLIETFDAWEPWDSIHQYPSKVAWEIWAYSHAAVRGSKGQNAHSAGAYISWMNRRQELLPEETVDFIVTEMNASADDLNKNAQPGGPCLVYSRKSLEASLNEPDVQSRGEEMDDWGAMLTKYGTPILSIVRNESLTEIEADGLIYPLPSQLEPEELDYLKSHIESEKLLVLMGDSSRIHPDLRAALGIVADPDPCQTTLPSSGMVNPAFADRAKIAGLTINQRRRALCTSPTLDPAISALGGPVLAQVRDTNVWVWETPEWGTPHELHMTAQSIQSPQTYALVSDLLGDKGWGADNLQWSNADWTKPICFLFWSYPSGEKRILIANLETGVTGNSQFCVSGNLNAKISPIGSQFGEPGKFAITEDNSKITLGPHRAWLLKA